MKSFQPFAAFAATAEHGSFAQAGRQLGQTPSTIAKSVARLEQQLGVKLFHRTTRQVSLTADGQQLFARCQRVLDELTELEALAAGARGEPTGTLRVDAPIVYGRRFVLPVLASLLERYPKMRVDLRLSDRYCDPVKDGIDAVIRVGGLADSSLVARRFSQQTLVLIASPAYLKRMGTPRSIDSLSGHVGILFRVPTTGRERPWQLDAKSKPLEVVPEARCLVNDGEAMVEAACAGLGIAQVPDYMANDQLGAGRLVEVLPAFKAPPMPISVVYPGRRMVPPRVRVLINALIKSA
jgi:DNA-binding transcriptional LysR family regulator